MKKFFVAALGGFLLATAGIADSGQRQLSLSGVWKLDPSRSHFSAGPRRYANMLITFEQQEQSLVETLAIGDSPARPATVVRYSLDGKEIINGTGDDQIKTRALWKGQTLVLQWTDDGGTFTQEVSLSADRQTLTVTARDLCDERAREDLLVFSRQPRTF
jgi:hypothetical protein